MLGYAIVDKETKVVECIFNWDDNSNIGNYPIEEDKIIIELNENQYSEFQKIICEGKRIKLLDIKTLEFEAFVDEVSIHPTELELLKMRQEIMQNALDEMMMTVIGSEL